MLIPLTFLFLATLISCSIIFAKKERVQALKANLDSAGAYYNRGVSYAKQGKYKLAIADYSQAIEIDSNSADAHHNRGVSYAKLGRNQKASLEFNQLQIFPSKISKFSKIGICCQPCKNFVKTFLVG